MLTRLYIDNYRAFVNFEYKPGPKQLILGANGSGKSSLLDALLFLRNWVVTGSKFEDWKVLNEWTRWLKQPHQTFEVDVSLPAGKFTYKLVLESSGSPARVVVNTELVSFEGRKLFEFKNGEVSLVNEESGQEVKYPFDPSRSALATIAPKAETSKLALFKHWFLSLLGFRINPFSMSLRAEREDLIPRVDLLNFASWYRHVVQAFPKENHEYMQSLKRVLTGFDYLKLDSVGENVRYLIATFQTNSQEGVGFQVGELSDGQRCLIGLYAILHFVVARGGTVIIDEPDNFVSLREIQPWLEAASDAQMDSGGQVFIITHHPEIINQWAPSFGVKFFRDNAGPIRAKEFEGDTENLLTPAELIARGWVDA